MTNSNRIKELSGLVEIQRKDMPQIKSKNLEDAIKILNKHDINTSIGLALISKLKPIQDDYNPEKVKSIVNSLKTISDCSPIFVSKDGFIVDGHHRWLAIKDKFGDDSKIPTVKINLPKNKALKAYELVSKKV